MASSSIIHGRHLEVTVVGCNVFSESSRSHPLYVGLQYGANIRIAFPNHDVGMDPTFPNKFEFPLIEGERDLKFVVWKNINNNILYDKFIGSGRVQVHDIISKGSAESSYPFKKGNNGDVAGKLKLELRCTHTHSHPQNLSRDPKLSHRHPSSLHHSLSFPPPTSYYHPPSYSPPPPHHHHHYSHPYTMPPSSHYPSPSSHYPPHHYPSFYPPPPPPPLPPPPRPPRLSSIAEMASFVSIAASMFQLFGG